MFSHFAYGDAAMRPKCVQHPKMQYLRNILQWARPPGLSPSLCSCVHERKCDACIIIIMIMFTYNALVPVPKTSSKHSTSSHQTHKTELRNTCIKKRDPGNTIYSTQVTPSEQHTDFSKLCLWAFTISLACLMLIQWFWLSIFSWMQINFV